MKKAGFVFALFLVLSACASVAERTERSSGVGFGNYEVPRAG